VLVSFADEEIAMMVSLRITLTYARTGSSLPTLAGLVSFLKSSFSPARVCCRLPTAVMEECKYMVYHMQLLGRQELVDYYSLPM
jgi:hypothetical protein